VVSRLLTCLTVVSFCLACLVAFGREELMDHVLGLILLIVLIYCISVFFLTEDDDL
jgi:uncharacterized membrane protein